MYPINNSPCAIPIILTKNGSWNMYFIGIANNNNNRREVPSSKATVLKNFNIINFYKSEKSKLRNNIDFIRKNFESNLPLAS